MTRWRVIYDQKIDLKPVQDATVIVLAIEEGGEFRGRRRAMLNGLDEANSGVDSDRLWQAAVTVAASGTRIALEAGDRPGEWPDIRLNPSEVDEQAAAGAGRPWHPGDVIEEFDLE
jgi:hypothetical protein